MQEKVRAAPTVIYPESDGKPIAETEYHRDIMIDFIQMLKHYFRNVNDVHVSGNLLMYYEEDNPRKAVSPDVFVVFGLYDPSRSVWLQPLEAQVKPETEAQQRAEAELAEALAALERLRGKTDA